MIDKVKAYFVNYTILTGNKYLNGTDPKDISAQTWIHLLVVILMILSFRNQKVINHQGGN